MRTLIRRIWNEDDGVLSFEWVLLITLLAIGIVGGLAAARDAIIEELGDVSQAAINIDQSYQLDGIPELNIDDVMFDDDVPLYEDCDRSTGPIGQSGDMDLINDTDS